MKVTIIILIFISLLTCGQTKSTEKKQLFESNTDFLLNNNTINIQSKNNDTLRIKKIPERKVEIGCNWQLTEGWFPNENLTFKRTDDTNYVFILLEKGTIAYHTEKGFGDCPVGAFTMQDGNWKKSGQNLTLELRGLKISDYWYWWKVEYKIKELTTNNLKLQVIKIIKNKEISPNLEWEDLIKD